MRKFLVLMGAGLSGCSGDVCETVEGVYATAPIPVTYNAKDVKTFGLLRFYDDGQVLSVPVDAGDLDESWSKIRKWFNRENSSPNHSIGSFECAKNKISFSVVSQSGAVDYTGRVKDGSLVFNTRSHINGHRGYGIVYKKTLLGASEP